MLWVGTDYIFQYMTKLFIDLPFTHKKSLEIIVWH